eukprot:scaffold257_cov422-Prasinococcus_capsulatus_cf.AAC.6
MFRRSSTFAIASKGHGPFSFCRTIGQLRPKKLTCLVLKSCIPTASQGVQHNWTETAFMAGPTYVVFAANGARANQHPGRCMWRAAAWVSRASGLQVPMESMAG